MPYSVRVDETSSWIEFLHEGLLDTEEINCARREAAEWMSRYAVEALLVDLSRVDFSQLSFFDIFSVNSTYADFFNPLTRVRLAFVVGAERVDDMQFAETVARNRGLNCRMFLDRDGAIKWLRNVVSP